MKFKVYFLLTKQVLLITIIIVVGKLTRSKVLRGVTRLCGALRGKDGIRHNHAR